MIRHSPATDPSPTRAPIGPARIALLYAIAAALWIVLSGTLLSFAVADPALRDSLEVAKGLAFVAVTSGLLYLLLARSRVGEAPAASLGEGHSPATRRLVLLFVLLALVVPLIGWFTAAYQRPKVEQAAFANLEEVAKLKAERIESWLVERNADSLNLAADPAFRKEIAKLLAGAPKAELPEAVFGRLDGLRVRFHYASILLLDAGGRLLHALGEQPDTLHFDQAPVRHALARGDVARGDLYRDEAGRSYLDWVAPIFAPEPSSAPPVAAVVLRARAEGLVFGLLQDWPGSRSSAETLLVRRVGDSFEHLNELRFPVPPGGSGRIRAVDAAMLATAATRAVGPGTVMGVDYRGEEVLAAYRPVAGTNWRIVAKIDRDEMMGSLRELALWTGIIAVCAFVAIGLAMLALWRQQQRAHALAVAVEKAKSDALIQQFFDLPFIGMAMTSAATKQWLRFNDRLCEILGYPREVLSTKSWAEITHPGDLDKDVAQFERVMRGESDSYAMDKRFIRGDGATVYARIDVKAVRGAGGAVDYFVATIQDISESMRGQAQLLRQRNLYAALSDTNQAVVRLVSSDELFRDICTIAVERAGFPFAWMGIADAGTGLLRPVARHGEDRGYVDAIRVAIDGDDPERLRPGGRAFRLGTRQIVNDIEAEPTMAAWRDEARKAGLRGLAAFPVRRGGEVIGVLSVYSTEVDEFDEEVVALLEEMASDVSFGLDNRDRERHRAEAVAALEAAEARWKFALEGAEHGVFEWNAKTDRVYYSPKWKSALGYAEHEIGDGFDEWAGRVHLGDIDRVWQDIRRHFSGETPIFIAEFRMRCRDGSYKWVQARAKVTARNAEGEPVMVVGTQTDITERKQAEGALLRRDAVLAAIGVSAQRFLLSTLPWREAVDEVLAQTGKAAEVSRVYLFENIEGHGATLVSRQTHEWVAEGVASFLDDSSLHAFRWADFGAQDLAAALERGEPVYGHRRELPELFSHLLAEESIESLALVPVFVDRRFWGLLGFDQCDRERKWEASERESLAMIAATLGAAIHEETVKQVLVESEARFRRLVEQSLVGIFIIDGEQILYANPRATEILGYQSGELIEGPFRMLVSGADWPAVENEIRRIMTGEIASGKVEFSTQRKDGQAIVIGAQGIRILHEGRPATLGVMQDISEKKRIEEQMRRYVTQLEGAVKSTVGVAMSLSEMRDPYTAGHERRVAELAVAIGRELGLDEETQEGLRVAGQLHDVGKMTIPTEILSKPGKLSAVEYELIKGHAQASYEVLKDVDFPWPVAEIAWQHHERVDGSGYPRGLRGEEILLEARIMAVADVVEAMSSHRPYRAGLGIEKALAEIERGLRQRLRSGGRRRLPRALSRKGLCTPAVSGSDRLHRLSGGGRCITASISTAAPRGQRSHADRGTCRIGLAEVRRHRLVHLGEVAEVGKVDRHPHHLVEIAPGGTADREEVVEDAAHLVLETVDQLHRLRVERESVPTGTRYRRRAPPASRCRWRRAPRPWKRALSCGLLLQSGKADDFGDAAHSPEDLREVHPVPHLDREDDGRVGAARALLGRDVVDVGVRFRDLGGQPREHAPLVGRGEPHVHVEEAPGRGIPLHVDPLLGIEVEGVDRGAVVRVHDETLPFLDLRDDRVAGNGSAAGSELHGDALRAPDRHRLQPVRSLGHRLGRGEQLLRHHHGEALAQPDVGQHLGVAVRGIPLEEALPVLVADLVRVGLERAKRLHQQQLAHLGRLRRLHGLQVVPDVGTRLAGGHVGEPHRVRARVGVGHDFHAVAVAKSRAERNRLAVHARRDAVVADVGVHGVGEVDGRGPARQREDLALGREDVDLLGEEVHLDVLEEFEGVARFALDLEQRLKPLVGLERHVLRLLLGALVEPVRGDAASATLCISGVRICTSTACRRARRASCAATGSRSPWGWRCSP